LQIHSGICAPKISKIERDLTRLLRKSKGCSFYLTVYMCVCVCVWFSGR